MALDIGLGVFVLIWAVRGWFKGFLSQVLGLGSLVAAVYSASQLRDIARPYAVKYLPSVGGELLDRLLWWGAVVAAMIVLSGLGGWAVRLMKRRPPSSLPIAPKPNRADQGAGFLLGAAKGAVAASFLAAGIVQFAPVYLEPLGGSSREAVESQKDASRVLAWATENRPAEQIWKSAPVQSFVAQVTHNGLWAIEKPRADGLPLVDPPKSTAKENTPSPPGREREEGLRTASRMAPMEVRPPRPEPGTSTFLDDIDREMSRLGLKPGGH